MPERGLFISPSGEFESQDEILKKGGIISPTPQVNHESDAGSFFVPRIIPPEVGRPSRLETPNFESQLEHLDRATEVKKEVFSYKKELEVSVTTGSLPFFAFRGLSDFHYGGMGTNTEEIKNHLNDIDTLPIFTAFLGDMANMYLPTVLPQAMLHDSISPDEQLMLVNALMRKYQDKILLTVPDPSHPGWLGKAAGLDPQRMFTEGTDIPTVINGGLLKLKVNDIEYKGLVFHKIKKYNSSLNITNAGKRMLDMMADVDFVISGHTHIGSFEKLVKREKKPVIVQMGTFKTDDDYGMIEGMAPNPQIFFPTLLFDGSKKNIELIEDREMANKIIRTFIK